MEKNLPLADRLKLAGMLETLLLATIGEVAFSLYKRSSSSLRTEGVE